MQILAVGDVCGEGGMSVLGRLLRKFIRENGIDLCVVNGENASMRGLTPDQAERIFESGADVITLGNHSFAKRQICDYLDEQENIIRPANAPPQMPGHGVCHLEVCGLDVCVVNLMGRLNMGDFQYADPFPMADKILKNEQADIFVFDFHAEATSEKKAFGYHLDGRASAVWGTHTHVATADETVLPQGCGYITDVGMTGAANSVIGVKFEQSVAFFRGELGPRFENSELDCAVNGAIFNIDEKTKKCIRVTRICIE